MSILLHTNTTTKPLNQNKMKQTAVEWFIEQLPRRILYIYENEIEQAKAMEKVAR